jgi:hypothetical protein
MIVETIEYSYTLKDFFIWVSKEIFKITYLALAKTQNPTTPP